MDTVEERTLERSKDKLKKDIEKHILKSMDDILNIAEVAIGDPLRYKPFRSKVLRYGNDAIREVKKLLDINYKVLFVPSNEDIIQVQKPTISSRKIIQQSLEKN